MEDIQKDGQACSSLNLLDHHDTSFGANRAESVFSHTTHATVEDGKIMKQRRRRTSPRDQAVLEAAYQKNSKPDKLERALIVKEVELGEKEVQIWFQNRRQNDRRKSKPLLPHELIPHFRNGVPTEAATQLMTPKPSQENCDSDKEQTAQSSPGDGASPSSRSSGIRALLNPSSPELVSSILQATAEKTTGLVSTPPSSTEGAHVAEPPQLVSTQETDAVQQTQDAGAKLNKKRSHEEMNQPSSQEACPASQLDVATQPTLACPDPPFVRLAMTAEGAVKVRMNNELTPSPPKKRVAVPGLSERANTSASKSRLAIEESLNFRDINPPVRRAPGRSRDARTWEFYCDRDAREALAVHAEEERSGSAANAINLIRSASQRRARQALSPNPAKQTSRRSTGSIKQRPTFPRARSSVARLQTSDSSKSQHSASTNKKPRHQRSSSSGDSDKENWAPGTRDSFNHLRRMHPSVQRDTVLVEHDASADSGVSARRASEGADDRSISTVSPTKTKAKVDDLDCVQGLLSLSQGAWR